MMNFNCGGVATRILLVACFSFFSCYAMENLEQDLLLQGVDEEVAALHLGEATSPKVQRPCGMVVLLYGTSSSGKSATMRELKTMLAGIPGWVFIAMDDIPDAVVEKTTPPPDVEPVVACTLQNIVKNAKKGLNVVCDMVLAGESVTATERTLDFAVECLRGFLVAKVCLGVDVPTLVQRVYQRNRLAKEDERRNLSEALSQIGRVFKLAQPLQLPATPFSISPQEISSACSSPMMFSSDGEVGEVSAARLQQQQALAERIAWGIGYDLGIQVQSPSSSPFPRHQRLGLVPRESAQGFRPDLSLNTACCSPRESATRVLQVTVSNLFWAQSNAMKAYRRGDIGRTMGDCDFVCHCDRLYAGHGYPVKKIGNVVVRQIPGLFAYYPCLANFKCYQKIKKNPSGYYAAFFATQAYCHNGFLRAPTLFSLACNNRMEFEQNTLRHGLDIVTNVRRKFLLPIETLDAVTPGEMTKIFEDTLGLHWPREHVAVVDTEDDFESLQSLFFDQVQRKKGFITVLFHPQENMSPLADEICVLPTWATMIVEPLDEGNISCCIIDPVAKSRLDDPVVTQLCAMFQLS